MKWTREGDEGEGVIAATELRRRWVLLTMTTVTKTTTVTMVAIGGGGVRGPDRVEWREKEVIDCYQDSKYPAP